jgi:hypothetical protein
MTREATRLDISTLPEVARLARAVVQDGRRIVLQDGDRDLAVLSPAPETHRRRPATRARTSGPSPARPRRRTKSLTTDDPLFRQIGTDRSDYTDVSNNKDRYLADAYEQKGRPQTS